MTPIKSIFEGLRAKLKEEIGNHKRICKYHCDIHDIDMIEIINKAESSIQKEFDGLKIQLKDMIEGFAEEHVKVMELEGQNKLLRDKILKMKEELL